MRIPFSEPTAEDPDPIVQAVVARRGGKLLPLDRMLLHSLAFTQGWNSLLIAVRTQMDLIPRQRELAMLSVAVLNGAHYEVAQHTPLFLAAGGDEVQVEALKTLELEPSGVAALAGFEGADRSVLALSLEITGSVQVSDETFTAARAALGSDKAVVEMIGVIAAYNMVTRFLVALDLHQP